MSKEDLLIHMKLIKDALQMKENEEILSLRQKCVASGIEYLDLLSEAVLHEKLNILPTTEKLGYCIASEYYNFDTSKMDKNTKELYYSIRRYLDVEDYVFSTTHYDSMSSGSFFRMS
jgi:hypothetical protein